MTRQPTDAETGHSSVEELVPLMSSARPDLLPDERRFLGRPDFQLQQIKKRQRREARRKMRMTLTNLLREEELRKLIKEKEGERLSLPASPFLTRKVTDNKKSKSKNSRPVTADQVKKALADKSRRYRMGNFKPLGGRPNPPPQSPTDMLIIAKRTKSLTDLSTFLQSRLDSSNLSNNRSVKRQRSKRRQQYNSRTLPNNKNNRPKQPRPVSSSSFHRKLQTYSREAAGSRLSNATAASSQLSVDSCELELDLYDYNLDNVAANSMFAAQLPLNQWSFDEDDLNTPIAEEFQLRELFPNSNSNNNNNNIEEDEVTLREHPIGMTNSRTSDLTASVTSAELSNDIYGKMTFSSFKPPPPPPANVTAASASTSTSGTRPNILSLTHIEGDDISFADNNSSDNDDNLVPAKSTPNYRQQYTKC